MDPGVTTSEAQLRTGFAGDLAGLLRGKAAVPLDKCYKPETFGVRLIDPKTGGSFVG